MRTPSYRRIILRASPLLVVACASGGSSPPPPGFELLRCQAANAAAAEATVDAAGDVLTVRGHTFRLPPGAVRRGTRFRVQDRATGHAGVDIRPHGTVFETPAQLTISYARCDVGAGQSRNLQIVEVRPGGTAVVGDPLPSRVDSIARTVTVEIEHLSGYLIGSNRGSVQ
jgi:hypothetical protein